MEKEQLKAFVFASIISADNDEFEEDVKQEIVSRYDKDVEEHDWEYILEPIADKETREKLVKLLKE